MVALLLNLFVRVAWLAQLVEHQTFNLRVKGSSPLSGDTTSFCMCHFGVSSFELFLRRISMVALLLNLFLRVAWLAQLVEHKTFNLRVKVSSPFSGGTTIFWS